MNISTQSLQSALEPLVGDWVRPAGDADMIVGVQPQVVVEPGNEEEVAAVLTFAGKEGLHVLVRGGGTQLGLGFAPTGGDILLSTAHLNRIVEHVPHDLVVTAQAGLPLATLQATLAQSNQCLALDPDLPPAATIGGIVATNASGPRRLRYGGVRDQIIGVRVVLADGTIAKGGGKVVKNVAGYDLPKLLTGALGTLGIIVSATFRLYPLPIASLTVQLTASSLTPLCDLAVRIIGSTLVPTIVDVLGDTAQENAYTMAVRFEMGQEAVEVQAATLLAMAAEMGEAAIQEAPILKGDEESQFWAQAGHATSFTNDSHTMLTLKASLLPSKVAHWLTRLEQVCQQQQMHATWRAHAGHGLVLVNLTGDATTLVTTTHELRQAAMEHQGSMVITEASLELMPRIDVWGPVPALDVMRNLKARFDPHNMLNPGRFVGGL